MRIVQIVPYTGEWLESFRDEAARLAAIFNREIITIHHIGSTAIPGMPAKPIVDMLPVVRSIEAVDKYSDRMKNAGYIPRGEYGLAGRRYFIKGTHHVHIYQQGHPDIERHLAFRDYLYAFPEIAGQYKNLKLDLVKRFNNDPDAYMDGKDAFIKRVEADALRWKRGVVK